MKIDLSCPAEIVKTELVRGEESWIRLILMNLTERGIDSCEATVRLMDREGQELGRTVHRARALKGRARSAFSMMIPMDIPENAASAEAQLDKVWLEDRDVWRRDKSREMEYESNRLPEGNDLNALRFVAGDGAVGFPSQQANLWICVCGRPNENRQMICTRCGRQRETVFHTCNREAVLRQVSQRERQLDLETRGAREETARLQRIREEAYDRVQARKRRTRRIIITILCLAALAAAGIFAVEPGIRLWRADQAMGEDRLEEARDLLTGLGNFPGAEERLRDTEQRIARRDGELAAAGGGTFTREQMTEIAAFLREKGTETGDGLLADRVDLAIAGELLKEGDLDGAEGMLNRLPETLEGRAAMMTACAFARGEKALAEGDYQEAREIFEGLGAEAGAAEKALEARYSQALAWMETGEYDAAIAEFSALGDYQDSPELIPRIWYLKGFVLEGQGDQTGAVEAYRLAGEYEDAAERLRDILWNQAEAFLAKQQYMEALPLYRELDGYQDARAKWLECATELARTAHKQREYGMALHWLEDLPEDTKEIRQIRTRALYLGAKAAAGRGELAEAIAMGEQVLDYSNTARLVRNWRMELAEQKMELGAYQEALELLEPVSENYNVKQMIREIEKKQAEDTAEKAGDEGNAPGQEESEGDTPEGND